MANLDNAKIYKKVSKTGAVADQYAVVNLDATNFCVTIGGSVYGVANRFENINNWAVWKRDEAGHVTVATPYAATDAVNKGYVDGNFVNVGDIEQEIGGYKTFNNYLRICDDGEGSSSARRPNNASSFSDPDLYIYAHGFTLHDADNDANHFYSLPDHSGTFAMTNDIGLVLLDLRGQS